MVIDQSVHHGPGTVPRIEWARPDRVIGPLPAGCRQARSNARKPANYSISHMSQLQRVDKFELQVVHRFQSEIINFTTTAIFKQPKGH